MSFATFDTLAFSKRLQSSGMPAAQADAQASAQVEFFVDPLLANMATQKQLEHYVTKEGFGASISRLSTKDDLRGFATKADLERFATKEDLERFPTKDDLKGFATKEELERVPTKEEPKGVATKAELERFATKEDIKAFATKADLERFPTRDDPKGFATKQDLELLGKNLTIRLGGMLVVAVAALATLIQIAG